MRMDNSCSRQCKCHSTLSLAPTAVCAQSLYLTTNTRGCRHRHRCARPACSVTLAEIATARLYSEERQAGAALSDPIVITALAASMRRVHNARCRRGWYWKRGWRRLGECGGVGSGCGSGGSGGPRESTCAGRSRFRASRSKHPFPGRLHPIQVVRRVSPAGPHLPRAAVRPLAPHCRVLMGTIPASTTESNLRFVQASSQLAK